MDQIQRVLVKAGRKDLAQKYYEKVAAKDLDKFVDTLAKEINKGTYWEDAIGDVEKSLGRLNFSEQKKMMRLFKKKHGKSPDSWMQASKQAERNNKTFKCPDCGCKVLDNTSYCVKCQDKVENPNGESKK